MKEKRGYTEITITVLKETREHIKEKAGIFDEFFHKRLNSMFCFTYESIQTHYSSVIWQ